MEIPSVQKDENFNITYMITNHGYANVTNATVTLKVEGAKILDNQTKIFSVGLLNSTNISFKLKAKDKGMANLELLINYNILEIENTTNITLVDVRDIEIEKSGVINSTFLILIACTIVICVCIYIFKKKDIII